MCDLGILGEFIACDALLSTTAKGLGNSSYGFTLYSAASGVDTQFV